MVNQIRNLSLYKSTHKLAMSNRTWPGKHALRKDGAFSIGFGVALISYFKLTHFHYGILAPRLYSILVEFFTAESI